ncbi:hypothetical protein INR49_021627 [Caranx melampygus]|nr:hypothetical protein INR49_021627 [Caranx melampygus]
MLCVVYMCQQWLNSPILHTLLKAVSWTEASRVSDPVPSATSLLLPSLHTNFNFFSGFERGLQPDTTHRCINYPVKSWI